MFCQKECLRTLSSVLLTFEFQVVISSVRSLVNCFKPINIGRAGLGRMQKHATEVSRLKAEKKRAWVGRAWVVIARGEKVYACVGKKESKRLLKCPVPSIMKHSYWRHGFSLSGSEPTSLATCHLQSISTGELPVDKTEVRGTMLASFKPTSNIWNNLFHKGPGLLVQQNVPADYFFNHSQEHQHTAAWVVAAPSSAWEWGVGGVSIAATACLAQISTSARRDLKSSHSDIPAQSSVDKLNDGKAACDYAWERLSLAVWRASVWEEAAAICEFFSCLYPTLPPQQRDLLLSLQHVPKSKLCHILGKQWLYQLFSQPEPDILKACHGNASWLRTHPDLLVRRVSVGKGSTRSRLESQLQRLY